MIMYHIYICESYAYVCLCINKMTTMLNEDDNDVVETHS